MPAKRMEIKYALNADVSGRCDSVVASVILTTNWRIQISGDSAVHWEKACRRNGDDDSQIHNSDKLNLFQLDVQR